MPAQALGRQLPACLKQYLWKLEARFELSFLGDSFSEDLQELGHSGRAEPLLKGFNERWPKPNTN
jgi:hypothetical protein